jgi:hypothetical protein
LLAGQPVPSSSIAAKGCLINFTEQKPPTYTADVAPILKRHCIPCHSPGGVAPWSMDNYQKVRGWGKMIREVVRIKRMPPWHADAYYARIRQDISLSPPDVRTLIDWVEQGFVRGEGDDPLESQDGSDPNLDLLGEPDLVLTAAKAAVIPAAKGEQFIDLLVREPMSRDLWVKAIDLRPGNLKAVHHGNAVALPPRPQEASQKDAPLSSQDLTGTKEREEWFRRSGTPMENERVLSGYSPGSGPSILPEGSGMFIPKGARLLFRMHYVPTGKPETDLPSLALYLHKEKPAHVVSVRTITNRNIKIPPGMKDYRLSGSTVFKKPVTLTTLTPHMHYRGKSMKFTIEYPDGKSEIVLSVPQYKFRWQRQYHLEKPKVLPAGTRILVDAVYDNSAQNEDNPAPEQEALYGPQSNREMFTAILYYIVNEDSHAPVPQ